jgi:hypothetical protein
MIPITKIIRPIMHEIFVVDLIRPDGDYPVRSSFKKRKHERGAGRASSGRENMSWGIKATFRSAEMRL